MPSSPIFVLDHVLSICICVCVCVCNRVCLFSLLAQGFKQSAGAVTKIQTHASALSNHITTLKDNVDEIGEMADDLNEWYCNASERALICGAIRLLYQTCASSNYV